MTVEPRVKKLHGNNAARIRLRYTEGMITNNLKPEQLARHLRSLTRDDLERGANAYLAGTVNKDGTWPDWPPSSKPKKRKKKLSSKRRGKRSNEATYAPRYMAARAFKAGGGRLS